MYRWHHRGQHHISMKPKAQQIANRIRRGQRRIEALSNRIRPETREIISPDTGELVNMHAAELVHQNKRIEAQCSRISERLMQLK